MVMGKTQRHKFSFENASSQQLAAILERPEETPRAWLLYAHCFTCSKDIITAARISRALVNHGFAVMRFDFTGLGESEGEFSETNFTTNIQDILTAADHLRKQHQAPNLLMGHSFGGAAMLAAAKSISECQAVITLATPSEPANIFSHFHNARETIQTKGEMQVRIGNQDILLTRQFLEDVDRYHLEDSIRDLDKPLLILHAPDDKTVSVEQAKIIFKAAPHPKNFIALDGADHLLTNREDALFVADIIAAWVKRYVTH